jgi:hypothetical protein
MAPKFTEEQIQAQRDVAASVAAKLGSTGEPVYAHIGFLRSAPRGRAGNLGLRFYPTGDLLGQALEHRTWWESIETVRVA